MPVPGLDAAKCEVRNLKAARKGVHTIPLRLATKPPEGPSETPVSARGTLPKDESAALRAINAILGKQGDDALRADQVYLLYPEAGNTNYIGDRYMFLGESTLRNVAGTAEAGFAFMNSHRTGDLSTPSELPYGRTFAGRFEKSKDRSGSTFARSLLGVYMLRDLRPNGANGPSTDDLYRGIDGGTIFDVSLGLFGGWCQCDVCGNDLDDFDPETYKYLCPHIPGTTRRMTADEVAAQESRGIPGGVATFTLQESSPGEVSAVFDGAVPGAGFAKAFAFARHGRLTEATRSQLFSAYRPFWTRSDLRYFPKSARLGGSARTSFEDQSMPSRFAKMFRFWRAAGEPDLSPEDLRDLSVEDDDDEVPPDVPPRFRKRFQVGQSSPPAPTPAPTPTEPPSPPAPVQVEFSPETKALLDETNAKLAAATARAEAAEKLAKEQEERREREAEVARKSALATASAAFAKEQVEDLHLAIPAERDDLTEMFRLCSEVDRLKLEPIAGTSLLEVFRKLQSHRKPHNLTTEQVASADGTIKPPAERPAGTKVLSNQGQDPDAPPSIERKKELLSLIPSGRAAIENGLVK